MATTSLAQLKEARAVKWILLVGSICGAIATIYKFSDVWDAWHLPRPVFLNEHQQSLQVIRADLTRLEIDYLQRAIASDQKNLRDLERDIQDAHTRNTEVADGLLELRDRLQESLRIHRDRLDALNVDRAH